MSRAAERRRRVAHYAAPVLFLAAVTVAVLLIRSGLEAGSATTPTATVATTPRTTTQTTTARHRQTTTATPAGAQYYTVQTGDTFNAISAKTGVPVSKLEQLNPGVSSNALQVGQRLRVK